MAFYVAVGPRGLLFRFGMLLTGVMGPFTYWWASRRRPAVPPPWAWTEVLLSAQDPRDLPEALPIDLRPTRSLPGVENAHEWCEALR
jgi:hypothetical protein